MKLFKKKFVMFFGGIVLWSLYLPSIVIAGIPLEMNYQGRVTDSGGKFLNGTYDMKFRIYNHSIDGNELWNAPNGEVQSVLITDGIFNVNIGSVVPLSEEIFESMGLYLEIAVYNPDSNDWEIMAPRQHLNSVAYAFRAADADTLNGFDATAFLSSDGGLADLDNSNLLIQGLGSFDDGGEEGILYLGDTHNYIKAIRDFGVSIGTFTADDAIVVKAGTGNVGIGVSDPASQLDVAGNIHTSGVLSIGSIEKSLNFFTDGSVVDIISEGSALGINYPGENNTLINIGGGRVGVGTADPAVKFDVVGNSDATAGGTSGIKGENGLTGNIGYLGNYEAAVEGFDGINGNFGALGHRNWGVRGDNTVSGSRGYLGHSDYGVLGFRTSGINGYLGGFDHALGGENIRNGSYNTGGKIGTDTEGIYGWTNSQNTEHAAIVAANYGTGPGLKVGGGSNGVAAIFGGRAIVNGGATVDYLEITGGSDLSEYFDITQPKRGMEPVPGSLVSIDPKSPGKLVLSEKSYDRKVAGIISGAGGVATGLHMGQKNSLAYGEIAVALTGRVFCLSDASSGPITPGDLLTTSDTPGHAMKVTDHTKAQGAIIGKAMSGLGSGRGLVLVLVSLQ